jgi:dihydroflavonol-4-reductase
MAPSVLNKIRYPSLRSARARIQTPRDFTLPARNIGKLNFLQEPRPNAMLTSHRLVKGGRLKTAFVTGGTGFVGINLVSELTSRNWAVTCLHRIGSDLKYLRRFPVQLEIGDLGDRDSLERAVPENVDAIFHVAADTSAWSGADAAQTETNVIGTRNVVSAALRRGAKRFVLTSTASAFGRQSKPLSEETRSTALTSWINYERTKWLAEEEVRGAIKSGLSAVIMNPCAVFGPYDTSVWGSVFTVIRDGKMAMIPPGTVPINHVTEVVRAHIVAAERGRTGENYILGGEAVPFAQIFREMAKLMGVQLRAPVVPRVVFKCVARIGALVASATGKQPEMTPEMAEILSGKNRVSTDKAERELNYRSRPLEECLRDSYTWLKAEGLL